MKKSLIVAVILLLAAALLCGYWLYSIGVGNGLRHALEDSRIWVSTGDRAVYIDLDGNRYAHRLCEE